MMRRAPVAVLLLPAGLGLAACDQSGWCERFNFDCVVEAAYQIEVGLDEDGDGWVDGDDCDDNEPLAFPGAEEVCDGVDNDCDGVVDEGTPGLSDWWPDEDGDGFGDGSRLPTESCGAFGNYVDNGDDCDDEIGSVNPDAVERCDELDRDCDGDLTAGAIDAFPTYEDADEDEYGDPDTEELACEVAEGRVEQGGDCDDTDATVFPGADELCSDDIDSNCSGDDVDVGALDGDAVWVDGDGDGYGDPDAETTACAMPDEGYADNDLDCNDLDDFINPDAAECINEVDDDCNGEIDDDAEPPPTWYRDMDGDGYGTNAGTKTSCRQPAGYVEVAGDCNDTVDVVFPGGDEVCDTYDNDCDGLRDLADDSLDTSTLLPFYEDADGDGFGDPSVVQGACTVDEVPGYVDDATDCDPDDATIYPGAPEICGSGVVEDCELDESEALAICQLEGEVDVDDAAHFVVSGVGGGFVGYALGSPGDVDGDGIDEIWLSDGVTSSGGQSRLLLVDGSSRGELTTDDFIVQLLGEDTGDRTGSSVANLGDADGDGYDDFLIGAYTSDWYVNDGGVAWLWSGPLTGSVELEDEAWALVGKTASGGFGLSMAVVEGAAPDGSHAWAVGRPYASRGGVYLFSGPITSSRFDAAADAVLTPPNWAGYAGSGLADAGDTDGDGVHDLIITDPIATFASTRSGAAWVVSGPITADANLRQQGLVYGDSSYGGLGYGAAGLGDLDGDGYDDIALGAPLSEAASFAVGSVYLIRGPLSSGSQDADTAAWGRIDGVVTNSYTGHTLDAAGDIDGDGFTDLLIGAKQDNTGGTNTGSAFIVVGLQSGVTTVDEAWTTVIGNDTSGYLSSQLLGDVELDGDGVPDFLLSGTGLDRVYGFGRGDY